MTPVGGRVVMEGVCNEGTQTGVAWFRFRTLSSCHTYRIKYNKLLLQGCLC